MVLKCKKIKISPFNFQQIEAVAKVLADTETGLTGTEIGHILANCRIPDIDPTNTKWKRLYNAFVDFQNKHQIANHIIVFINNAMNPVAYTDKPEIFQLRQDKLNKILSLLGYSVTDKGKIRQTSKVETLNEALTRSNRLKETLRQRNVHENVLKYCDAEILQQNYFHAVFEAMKSITAKIRKLSNIDEDGCILVDKAFGFTKDTAPILMINDFSTKTLRGEQLGCINLLKGLYGTIRNPLAHEAKIEWDNMTEQDAVDILTMISLIHRKLENTVRNRH